MSTRNARDLARYATNAIVSRARGEGARLSFDSDGVSVSYADEGSGVPVVLLHGFAVSSDLNWRWPGITRELAREHRVVSMDLRGHGRSGKPVGSSSYGASMVSDVTRLLDHLGIERAHVAGYSLGGFVTLKLASVAPSRLISAAVLGAGWESSENGAFLGALPRLADALESGKGIGPLMEGLGAERMRTTFTHRLWVRAMTRYFNEPHALVGVIRGTPALALSEAEVRRIAVPVLGVVGDRDPMLHSARAMVERLPDRRLVVVEGADHLQAPMRPELLESLQRFLQTGDRG